MHTRALFWAAATLGLGVAVVAGCETFPPSAGESVLCTESTQPHVLNNCDEVWNRAQAWVAIHSGYRIRMATNVVIETYGPLQMGRGLAYKIVRTSIDDDDSLITITTYCDATIYGCLNDDPSIGAKQLRFELTR